MTLCKAGFFQIHLRTDTINTNIESRIAEETNSALIFEKYYQWKKGSSLYWQLESLDGQIQHGRGKLQYDPSFRKIFRYLSDQCYEENDTPYSKIYRIWIENHKDLSRTRSNFENICLKEFSDVHLINDAMSVVNSINHYAYGVAMSLNSSSEETLIETKELSRINYLTKPLLGESAAPASTEFMDELIKSRALDTVEKNLFVPLNIFRDQRKWHQLGKLVDVSRSTNASREFYDLKQIVVLSIKRTIESGGERDKRRLLTEACRAYTAFLQDHLKSKDEQQVSVYVKIRRGTHALGHEVAHAGAGEIVGKVIEDLQGGVPEKIFAGAVLSIGAAAVQHQITRKVGEWQSRRRVASGTRAADLRALHACLSVRRINADAVRQDNSLIY